MIITYEKHFESETVEKKIMSWHLFATNSLKLCQLAVNLLFK